MGATMFFCKADKLKPIYRFSPLVYLLALWGKEL